MFTLFTTRRNLLRGAGVSSLLAVWPVSKLFAAARRPRNIYQELGVRPLINLRGTHTTIGASKQWAELHEAMAQASQSYVVLDELQDKVGEQMAGTLIYLASRPDKPAPWFYASTDEALADIRNCAKEEPHDNPTDR